MSNPTPYDNALRLRIQARADGYRDALLQLATRRLAQHPNYRFAYDAGYLDGEQALEVARALDGAFRARTKEPPAPDPNPRWREG